MKIPVKQPRKPIGHNSFQRLRTVRYADRCKNGWEKTLELKPAVVLLVLALEIQNHGWLPKKESVTLKTSAGR